MRSSRYVLARTTTAALAAVSSVRLAPKSRKPRRRKPSQAPLSASSGVSASQAEMSPLTTAPPFSSAFMNTATVKENNSNDSSAEADVDEVERLLAATATAPRSSTSALARSSPTRVDSSLASASASPLAPPPPPSVLDPSSALHFQAVHQATSAAAASTTQGGPSHLQREQVERRRSKASVAEAEFDVGVTERLVPELPRLPALHEVHYGDAVMRELDRSLYFRKQHRKQTETAAEALGGASDPSDRAATVAAGSAATVVINGEPCVELSLDEDLSAADFAAFDAEAAAGATAAAAPSSSAEPSAEADKGEAAPAMAHVADTSVGDAIAVEAAAEVVVGDGLDDSDEGVVARSLGFGTARPWFVPPSGVVQLEPLSPADCALLLRFVLHLRQQTPANLIPSLRRALQRVEETPTAADDTGLKSSSSSRSHHALSLADVIRYLDTAPPPVVALTESLPSSTASSTVSSVSSTSPAFVFHLYLENVSTQNAIGHLATFFGIPQRCLQSHSAVSKMSCSTVLCAVAENCVRREHLLLLNTLRHPGFVLRVSSIQEVAPDRYPTTTTASASVAQHEDEGKVEDAPPRREASTSTLSVSQQLFGELARWQPLYQTELLLRRVCSDSTTLASGGTTRQLLEHRLRAVQTLGAICFCANREASLARAATDVLHGFFRSALLNALQRRKASAPLRRFLRQPNVATAQHAHHVSTDSTVRQVLKVFVQTDGDWHATCVRTPYVWRRRWINALRGVVWNTMASRRLRKGGREVLVGDVVLRPAYRQDVHRRGIVTVKAEHVMVVKTSAEAAAAGMEDVFLPFLRGRFPEHLFADEATDHPIMTRTNMLAVLRAMHAPQLLLGMTDDVRQLLDVRAESAPLLFRRLLIRPVAMEFAILEDKPPMRSLHYDAARLLSNDRWEAAAAAAAMSPSTKAPRMTAPTASADVMPQVHLLPPSEVLERTTLGSRLSVGVLAEEFFSVPSADEYVVLGHAHRHLSGELVPATPLSDTAEVGDRVYTVYVRAVVENNVAGLTNLLREYFLLSGIETEADSALQHKVHRMRRELDPETPLLTAPVYCTTCFNRDHDTQEQCAEYQLKRSRRAARRDVEAAVIESGGSGQHADDPLLEQPAGIAVTSSQDEQSSRTLLPARVTPPAPTSHTVCMRWRLRRRNEEQRWGVHLTKALHLVGLEDVQLIREGAVWSVPAMSETTVPTRVGAERAEGDKPTAMPDAAQACPWPPEWISEAATPLASNAQAAAAAAEPYQERTPVSSSSLLEFFHALWKDDGDGGATPAAARPPSESLSDLLVQSPILNLPAVPAALELHRTQKGAPPAPSAQLLKACQWTLTNVNATQVSTQRDVAAALLQHSANSREVWLTFEAHVALSPASTEGQPWLPDTSMMNTHAPGAIPQSTSALSPRRRHEAEAAMKAAVRRTSPETQRWLQDLPYRLTIVLVKHRRHLHKRRSWGLQLDGTDMTLVNFAKLMVQYMYVSESESRQLMNENAYVASMAPSELFPRNSEDITKRLFGEVLPGLEPLLNDMYRVVRINNTPVHQKAEAARAMAAFQASLDAQVQQQQPQQQSSSVLPPAAADTSESTKPSSDSPSTAATAAELFAALPVPQQQQQFFLTLSVERKGSSYRLCTATAAAPSEMEDAATPSPDDRGSTSTRLPSSPAAVTAASSAPLQVDSELLDGLATPHCPVRPLTPMQLTRSSVTIAINRLLLNEHTRSRWGLRLQQGSRRLKAVQQNRLFSFHVFAAKQSQGTRIADTLRLVTTSRPTAELTSAASPSSSPLATMSSDATTLSTTAAPAAVAAAASHVITRSFYLYYIERVNQQVVRGHAELRRVLFAAAQPAPLPSSDAPSTHLSEQQQQLPPESVTLTVRQFPLMRFNATVRRGGVGEESALGPVGLQVDRNMRILAVFGGSPMARALMEATGPLCSARRLLKGQGEARDADADAAAPLAAASWDVIALPQLRRRVVELEELFSAAAAPPSSAQSSTSAASTAPHRQWSYDLDEDEDDGQRDKRDASPDQTDAQEARAARTATASSLPSSSLLADASVALREMAEEATRLLQQLAKCSMVDGVHVLQASLLQEFARTQLAALTTPSSDADTVDAAQLARRVQRELTTLRESLEATQDQMKWEVVYAVHSNRSLRTPADLAAAFAPGVAEETISIQQYVED